MIGFSKWAGVGEVSAPFAIPPKKNSCFSVTFFVYDFMNKGIGEK